ncbi:MAG: hypothetical protein MUE44_19485 [Oscillatoriaceae cyanobacterium Prado104]|nr:hypothetical protein [Oscillatoriaceae cyanobacterium Prado104]
MSSAPALHKGQLQVVAPEKAEKARSSVDFWSRLRQSDRAPPLGFCIE